MTSKMKLAALILGAVLMTAVGATSALAAESKCGGEKKENADEGKCGGKKAAAKCGGEKKEKADESKCGGEKKEKAAKCGAGKCGDAK